MSLENQVTTVTAPGNGSATVFSLEGMVLFGSSDLIVTHTSAAGVETVRTAGSGSTNYSLQISAYPGTGTLTYPADQVTPMAAGETLTIERNTPATQSTRFGMQGAYNPNMVERGFDRLTAIAQQLLARLNLGLRFSAAADLSAITNLGVPTPVAGYALITKTDGTGFQWSNLTGATGPQGPQGPPGASGAGTGDMLAAQNLNDLANKATARTNLGVAIGTDVQAYSAILAALAGLAAAANKLIMFTGAAAASLLDFKDEDDMVSNSATAIPSQQSVKAYVDAQIAALPGGGVTSVVRQIFTANGTYTPTAGMIYCVVKLLGGGGGGASALSGAIGSEAGGGGGAGGYAEKLFSAADIGASKAVVIGAAGAAGASGASNNGGNGGNSTFGATLLVANGGTGGTAGVLDDDTTVANGGAGGTATATGGLAITGQAGQKSITTGADLSAALESVASEGGDGGNNILGLGGRGGKRINVAGANAGEAGVGFGAGGGGAAAYGGSSTAAGGAGTAGYCEITEFVSA